MAEIIDMYGRTWSWWKGGLYRHDQMAWTRDMIERTDMTLPSVALRDNPNYHLCSICTQDWPATPEAMQGAEQASDLHTCTPTGKALPFGRKAPVGQCARCDALRDGAPAKSWGGQSAALRAHNAQMDDAARKAHFAPGGPHAWGACGLMCTAFDW